MAGDYKIRLATSSDASIIARHRALMFFDMGVVSREDREEIFTATAPWTAHLLSRGEYVGWLAEEDGDVLAGGGIYLRELPPSPGCLKVGRWGHIANVYTVPAHRRRGIARYLMGEILQWCTDHSIDLVTLAASDDGRPLYESLGFVGTSEMRLPHG
jgi:GNAT superfamily N-acetyltransferase